MSLHTSEFTTTSHQELANLKKRKGKRLITQVQETLKLKTDIWINCSLNVGLKEKVDLLTRVDLKSKGRIQAFLKYAALKRPVSGGS